MASDRPDEADVPNDPDPRVSAGDGAGDANAEHDDSSPDRNPDNDALTIPSVGTETAGSGLWSDLKADLEIDSIDIPEVSNDVTDGAEADADASTEMAPDASDAPPELVKTFWALVLVINAALLAVSLGVLFLVFEGAMRRGGALLAGGLLLLGFAVRRYRTYRQSTDRSESDAQADADADVNADTAIGADAASPAAPADTATNVDESASSETSSNDVAEQRPPDDSDPS